MATIKELEAQLAEQTEENAMLSAKLGELEEALLEKPTEISQVAGISMPLRFAFGHKVKMKSYFSHTPGLMITKTYMDPLTQKASAGLDTVQFDGFWLTTNNDLIQKCIESQGDFAAGTIVLITEANKDHFVSLDAAKAKQKTYQGPATSATAAAELASQ